jgi:hypothetical protein
MMINTIFTIKVKQELIQEKFITVNLGSLDIWVSFSRQDVSLRQHVLLRLISHLCLSLVCKHSSYLALGRSQCQVNAMQATFVRSKAKNSLEKKNIILVSHWTNSDI